ncbi:MAG TPA: VRR-NUC domain-containing protein [Terriglobales bacterium]|nr:VRR-NUC domain-containing protein [Terriglobales bacterium]
MTFSEVLSWQQPKLSERRFQSQVLRYAALRGWHAYHTLRSDGSAAGFPDLVLVRRPRVVFAELKSDRGRCTPEQRAWLAELAECSVEVRLWRPGDWEEIERCLR